MKAVTAVSFSNSKVDVAWWYLRETIWNVAADLMSLSVVLLLSSHLAVPETCWYLEWNAMLLLRRKKNYRCWNCSATGQKTLAPWQPEIVGTMTVSSFVVGCSSGRAFSFLLLTAGKTGAVDTGSDSLT